MSKMILSPIKLGRVSVKNRIVFPSMCTYFCDSEGFIGADMLEYIRERAQGGIGLLIVPGSPHGQPGPGRPALSDDKYMVGWRTMADLVHGYGAKLFCQLHPAKIQAGRGQEVDSVNEYSKEFIRQLVNSYATGAKRCLDAGVDGVEIHGAHAHEVAQMMSPFYNRRTDEYGGDYRRRARFPIEIIHAIKDACGKDYPLIFRISGSEKVKGGREIAETVQITLLLEEAGADAIHVSVGMPESEHYISAPMDVEDCFNLESAAAVKSAVSIPVIAVNRFVTLDEAEQAVQDGFADMVAMARSHLSDPELLLKYTGECIAPPRVCVGCNQGCRDSILYKHICCMQNPRVGREAKLRYLPAPNILKRKKILIAGAGPAGLEAACVLAERGLKPIVYEQDSVIGGLIRLATKPPKKKNMEQIISYREQRLKQFGITIHLNTQVNDELLAQEKPDILFVATGSKPLIPPIRGLEGDHIYTGDSVLHGSVSVGKKVAVLGGGLIGIETADYLAEQGKQVHVFEMDSDVARSLNESRRYFLMDRVQQNNIQVHTNTKVIEVRLPKIIISNGTSEQTVDGFDSIVVAAGRVANCPPITKWAQDFPEMKILIIGDASGSGLAIDAIYQAAVAAAGL